MFFNAFLELSLLNYLWKMRGYQHFSFWTWIWIPITLAKIYFYPIVVTFWKSTSVLGGTVLKEELFHLFFCRICVVWTCSCNRKAISSLLSRGNYAFRWLYLSKVICRQLLNNSKCEGNTNLFELPRPVWIKHKETFRVRATFLQHVVSTVCSIKLRMCCIGTNPLICFNTDH